MAENVRYLAYFQAMHEKRQRSHTMKRSVLERLKELNDKDFILQLPLGEKHES